MKLEMCDRGERINEHADSNQDAILGEEMKSGVEQIRSLRLGPSAFTSASVS